MATSPLPATSVFELQTQQHNLISQLLELNFHSSMRRKLTTEEKSGCCAGDDELQHDSNPEFRNSLYQGLKDHPSSPLHLQLVLRKILGCLSVEDLRSCRLVGRCWNVSALPLLRQSSTKRLFVQPKHFARFCRDMDNCALLPFTRFRVVLSRLDSKCSEKFFARHGRSILDLAITENTLEIDWDVGYFEWEARENLGKLQQILTHTPNLKRLWLVLESIPKLLSDASVLNAKEQLTFRFSRLQLLGIETHRVGMALSSDFLEGLFAMTSNVQVLALGPWAQLARDAIGIAARHKLRLRGVLCAASLGGTLDLCRSVSATQNLQSMAFSLASGRFQTWEVVEAQHELLEAQAEHLEHLVLSSGCFNSEDDNDNVPNLRLPLMKKLRTVSLCCLARHRRLRCLNGHIYAQIVYVEQVMGSLYWLWFAMFLCLALLWLMYLFSKDEVQDPLILLLEILTIIQPILLAYIKYTRNRVISDLEYFEREWQWDWNGMPLAELDGSSEVPFNLAPLTPEQVPSLENLEVYPPFLDRIAASPFTTVTTLVLQQSDHCLLKVLSGLPALALRFPNLKKLHGLRLSVHMCAADLGWIASSWPQMEDLLISLSTHTPQRSLELSCVPGKALPPSSDHFSLGRLNNLNNLCLEFLAGESGKSLAIDIDEVAVELNLLDLSPQLLLQLSGHFSISDGLRSRLTAHYEAVYLAPCVLPTPQTRFARWKLELGLSGVIKPCFNSVACLSPNSFLDQFMSRSHE